MRAVKVCGPNDLFIDSTAPVPTVCTGHLLIKVLSVALNPTDWKRVAIFREEVPHTVGLDVAGWVVACGDEVGQEYKVGDRVAGLCYGIKAGDPLSGAFGEYALLKGALSLPVPDHVSDAEAATIPVGTNFVGQGESVPTFANLSDESITDQLNSRANNDSTVPDSETSTSVSAIQAQELRPCHTHLRRRHRIRHVWFAIRPPLGLPRSHHVLAPEFPARQGIGRSRGVRLPRWRGLRGGHSACDGRQPSLCIGLRVCRLEPADLR